MRPTADRPRWTEGRGRRGGYASPARAASLAPVAGVTTMASVQTWTRLVDGLVEGLALIQMSVEICVEMAVHALSHLF